MQVYSSLLRRIYIGTLPTAPKLDAWSSTSTSPYAFMQHTGVTSTLLLHILNLNFYLFLPAVRQNMLRKAACFDART